MFSELRNSDDISSQTEPKFPSLIRWVCGNGYWTETHTYKIFIQNIFLFVEFKEGVLYELLCK
jgi:hypothetical protein